MPKRLPYSRRKFHLIAVGGLLAVTANANAAALGSSTIFDSPAGTKEECIRLAHMPGGNYSEEDQSIEKKYCSIDFYDGNHALCAKTFSTSPGTLVYDISTGKYKGNAKGFEHSQCYNGKRAKEGASGSHISYKMTMNARSTSGTFSTASLLYYHFSRYFDMETHVPVSVYRSMDSKEHRKRVTAYGLKHSANRKGGAMNHAGWKVMNNAQNNPESYPAPNELFTADRTKVYGVLLHPEGKRYGAEFNGTRKSGWGEGQNRDFMQTPPFRALRAEKPADKAIKQYRGKHSPQQMMFWMQELTEITLLDYIFSQQDRIGNIDYISYWYWIDSGKIKSMPAQGKNVPAEIAAMNPVKIKRTQLNDNDAGGKKTYANFTKKVHMLENIRHYNPETYKRLMQLDTDFKNKGDLYSYVKDTFGLSTVQFEQIVKNTSSAAAIIRNSCQSGKLKFDLDPNSFMKTGETPEKKINCDNP